MHSKDSQGPKASSCGQRRLCSDQTGQMPRLIRVFAERKCLFAAFVVRRLSFFLFGTISRCFYSFPILMPWVILSKFLMIAISAFT